MPTVAETGLKLKRGYVSGAVLLYGIIQDAKKLERDMAAIVNLQKGETKAAAKKDVAVLKKDEARIARTMHEAVEFAEKLMANSLEMLRRFGEEQIWQIDFNRKLISSGASKEFLSPFRNKEAKALTATVGILESVANRAIGIRDKLLTRRAA